MRNSNMGARRPQKKKKAPPVMVADPNCPLCNGFGKRPVKFIKHGLPYEGVADCTCRKPKEPVNAEFSYE